MPVYHFTLHSYRSWSPNHRRGYTEKGKGYQPPSEEKAQEYDDNAKQDKVIFGCPVQEIIILGAYDICQRRAWRLHGVGNNPTHVHIVLRWREFIPADQVMGKIKNILSLLLGRALNEPGKRWFVTHGSRKRVNDTAHLNHLLNTYLPDHPGLFWKEGMELPEDLHGILEP